MWDINRPVLAHTTKNQATREMVIIDHVPIIKKGIFNQLNQIANQSLVLIDTPSQTRVREGKIVKGVYMELKFLFENLHLSGL